jgi:hypothetical protein
MDEKTSVLVCLGAATAANCIPCFEHYLKKAKGLGLSSEEILGAADLASKVKNGAHLVMRNGIRTFMGVGFRSVLAARQRDLLQIIFFGGNELSGDRPFLHAGENHPSLGEDESAADDLVQ